MTTRAQRGFTILELMIVVSIISIIAVIAIPNLAEARKQAQERAALDTMRAIYAAQLQHHSKLGYYANSIDDLCAAKLLAEPFRVGGTNAQGMQPKGGWEFCTRVPIPSSVGNGGTSGPPPDVNRTVRFRVAMQPWTATPTSPKAKEQRLKVGDQSYTMVETGKLYTHRYVNGCNLAHASATAGGSGYPDTMFGTTYPETEGSR